MAVTYLQDTQWATNDNQISICAETTLHSDPYNISEK